MNLCLRLSKVLLLVLLLTACRETNAEGNARLTEGQKSKPTRIMAGGYPETEDFERLKREGVTTIVTLLDDRLPEEKELIDQEIELASGNGMKIIRLPMSSRLSKATSTAYRAKVEAASRSISEQPGIVYFHCYHGVHRTGSVAEYLREQGYQVTDFVVQKRRDESERIDKAQSEYERGNNASAIAILTKLPALDHRALTLLGWAYYRNDQLGHAKHTFDRILERIPEADEARVGRGYVALREGDLPIAEAPFKQVLQEDHANIDAEMGLGLLRLKQSRFAPAQRHFSAVLKLDPNNSEAKKYLEQVSAKIAN